MAYELLQFERHGRVALIRLRRPEVMNALSLPMREELRSALAEAESDNAIGAVVITGDDKAFADNYEKIFGSNKPKRGKFVWDSEKKEFVEFSQYSHEQAGPYVMGDIQPYQSMATGEMIQGRRQHREHLKAHGLVEIGNETKYISKRKTLESPAGLRETIAREVAYRS